MAGYIGSKASVVSSGAERKKTFTITGATTSLTGLNYTVGKVHVFQNGVRLVDGTDYTATNGTTITLTVAAQSGDNVVVISQASFQVADALLTSGGAMTGDLSFGDNDKAKFGAGSDLQIYHDPSNGSIIKDNGTGRLILDSENGTGVSIMSGGIAKDMIDATKDGAVKLYHNGSTKLTTTSTGIDVTGTVTSDGLTMVKADDISEIIMDANRPSAGQLIGRTKYLWNGTEVARIEGDAGSDTTNKDDGILRFLTKPSGASIAERLRIDSSGNLLVGKTSVDFGTSGMQFLSSGLTQLTATGQPLYLNRLGSDGNIVDFRKDGTTHGAIGRGGSGFFIAGVASSDFGVLFDGSGLISCTGTGVIRDNQYDMGHGGFRWNDIYATNGTIQTSDFNEKQDIASLTAIEMLVGKRISALFKTFRWKDKVVEKGDNARTHTGVIAQDVQAAFTAEGLDAGDYSLFISSTWWETQTEVPAVEAVAEVTDEDGNVTTEAVEAKDAYTRTDTYNTEAEAPEGATSKTRLGIRYPELLSFVAAYNEQRFASIEARLTALEA